MRSRWLWFFVLALINDVITPNAVNSANSPDDSLSSNCEGAFRFEITILKHHSCEKVLRFRGAGLWVIVTEYLHSGGSL